MLPAWLKNYIYVKEIEADSADEKPLYQCIIFVWLYSKEDNHRYSTYLSSLTWYEDLEVALNSLLEEIESMKAKPENLFIAPRDITPEWKKSHKKYIAYL